MQHVVGHIQFVELLLLRDMQLLPHHWTQHGVQQLRYPVDISNAKLHADGYAEHDREPGIGDQHACQRLCNADCTVFWLQSRVCARVWWLGAELLRVCQLLSGWSLCLSLRQRVCGSTSTVLPFLVARSCVVLGNTHGECCEHYDPDAHWHQLSDILADAVPDECV